MVTEGLSGIAIDFMTEADLSSVLEIERLSFTTPWSEASLFNELRNPRSVSTVARRGRNVIGYIFASRVVDEGHILTYAVHPDYRRLGVGSSLARDMIARLKEEDCRFIFLEVRASNEKARKIYESLGFTALGVRKSYYSSPAEDAVVMVLKLLG